MIVSWNWLAQYVRLDVSVEALADRLALSGLNHESTEEVDGDFAIDLEVTSNRPDCLGHLGVAREVGVLLGHPVREPDPRPAVVGEPIEALASISVEVPGLCPQFTARLVSGARVGESPWWMRRRLETAGVRPVSNVVDATNYVMLECGQPLHAYDFDRLAGRRLVVREARAGESLRAINGRTYALAPGMVAIADADRPVGLAGVMGGLDTEIGPSTGRVLVESARFDPSSIRRTARALGLHSSSSFRYERGLDPERTEWASRRCAELIAEVAGGSVHPGLLESRVAEAARPPIRLRVDQIRRILGIPVDADRAGAILRALGLGIESASASEIVAVAPSWRRDLGREIDLIEEVGRIHGYENVPEDRPVPLARSARGRRERVEGEVRSTLNGLGFDEAITFSLVSDDLAGPVEPGPGPAPLRVDHSSRKLEATLRQSLIPSLLRARAENEAHGNADAQLFEVANVYRPRAGSPLPDEPTRLALVSGRDFFALKGVVEALLGRLHLPGGLDARPTAHSAWFSPGRVASLAVDGVPLGILGEVDPAARSRLGLRQACAAAELDLGTLVDRAGLVPQHRSQPPFPPVGRDLSLVVARSTPWADLAAVVRSSAGPLLEDLSYLDQFSGGDLPPDRVSLHVGLRFRSPDRTLPGDEVDRVVSGIVEACSRRLDASLRSRPGA